MLLVLGASICAQAQTGKQKVAVYVTGDAESGYKKVIGSKLVSSLTRSDNYVAVERTSDFLSALNQEHDYQTSGAVSDNQIIKLGQQFGVRYVLVADVSEVFETLFVSARLINVQTGQITNSAEASLIVNSIDGLTTLTEEVIDGLTDAYHGITLNDIKIVGPFTYDTIYKYKEYIPTGYRVASKIEIEDLIKLYKRLRKTMTFPIYADLRIDEETQPYGVPTGRYYFHYKYITATLFENMDKQRDLKRVGYFFATRDNSWNCTTNVINGFIYLIKKN